LSFAERAQPLVNRAVLAALVLALGLALLPAAQLTSTVRADTPRLKAVLIVGPTHEHTDHYLEDAEVMAVQAEAAGYDVRRVFHPYATWDNVLANIQGANIVVYMGHGYGWPSPYTSRMMEDRQNGMGLNPYVGSLKSERKYYGAKPIRNNVHLAPHAVVILNHLCYAAGNGESGMAIPSQNVAFQRADNMANGWLYAGADAVFATTWTQSVNFPAVLATTNQTMEQIFETPSPWTGSPAGFIGWNDVHLDSDRTPGATVHLDPHPDQGYYRALTGKLSATTADFRSGAGSPGSVGANPLTASDPSVPTFYPSDGDGLAKTVRFDVTLTEPAQVDWQIRDDSGNTVRTAMTDAPLPAGVSSYLWDGKGDGGAFVPDGWYRSVVEATTGFGTYTQERSVFVGAFRTTPSNLSPARGGNLSLKMLASERMSSAVFVTIDQPGLAPWTVKASHPDTRRYKAAFTLKSGGSAGTLVLTIGGKDKNGVYQESRVELPLR
jgi:hypothetical protein